jgi:hypothetical protein
MVSTRRLITVLLLLVLGLPSTSRALEAVAEANGYSIGLGPAATDGGFTIFFTTYDGSSGVPLQDCDASTCFISQEFKPTSLGSKTYRADYFAADNFGAFEYGTVSITIDTSDSDGDGMLDALERARSGNFSFSGSATPHWNYYGIYSSASISGDVSRGSGSNVGTYSGQYELASDTVNYAGAFALSAVQGTAEYELGGSTVLFDVSLRHVDGFTRQYSGVSGINRIGTDAIEIPSFAISDSSSGLSILTQTMTLTREGNAFSGPLHVFDGEPVTSWDDYQDFRFRIVDLNDTDHNGIPDIVQIPEPSLLLQLLTSLTVLTLLGLQRRRSVGPPSRDLATPTSPWTSTGAMCAR